MKLITLGLATLFIFIEIATAQQSVDRSSVPDLLAREYDSTNTVLPLTAFWASFQRGYGSTEGEMRWNTKLGGLFAFYRWENSSLALSFSSELTISPNNNIGFDPKTVRWEENLFYQHSTIYGDVTLGIRQKCKHEVDNVDTDSWGGIVEELKKRVVYSTSSYFSIANKYQKNKFMFRSFARANWELQANDIRYPKNNAGLSYGDMIGELSLTLFALHHSFEHLGFYARTWTNTMLLEKGNEPKMNARAEIGTRILGKTSGFSLFCAYEYLWDDFTSPYPQRSEVFYIGFRMSDKTFW